jgi:protein-S-isoprenylcysteine O-methyltransferase Ste14
VKESLIVAAQFLLIGLLLWPFSGVQYLWQAALIALPALAFGFWTLQYNRPGNFNIRPRIRQGGTLVTDGPYAIVRHPMYVCVLWFGVAAVVLYATLPKLILLCLLYLVLRFKAIMEERLLLVSFPDYAEYMLKVGRFLPRRTPGQRDAE